jgi:hypothetical protein
MPTSLVTIAIQELPALIAAIRSLFVTANPTAPVPTDAEVIAAYQQAYALTVATDEAWLAAHPPTT